MNLIEKNFSIQVIKAFIADYQLKSKDNYVLNPSKEKQMCAIIDYCRKLEQEHGYKVIRCMCDPRYEQGYIQVLFSGELVFGKTSPSIEEFAAVLKRCDGINITTNPAGEDLFQITFFVENLWAPKHSDIVG